MTYYLTALILSCFSPIILAYISVATPLGPWIAPTFAIALVALFRQSKKDFLYPIAAGSPGGIMATAFGFAFPTFYFLKPELFVAWMNTPAFFILSVAALAFCASSLGLLIASHFRKSMIIEEELAFPVGQVVHKIVDTPRQKSQQRQLAGGFFSSLLFGLLQMKILLKRAIIPQTVSIFNKTVMGPFLFPALRFDLTMTPMLIALGFIAGSMITLPLFVGAFSQVFIIHPIHTQWFSYLSRSDFVFALCSGIVLCGAIQGMLSLPKQFGNLNTKSKKKKFTFSPYWIAPLVATCAFLSFFKFSLIAQSYVIFFSLVCAYQIAHIAGKIGLAFLGRFATFVMIPGMLLFGFDALQLTIVSTFVGVMGGVAADALFSYKAAEMAQLDARKIFWYQVGGILVSSLVLGAVFWLLCTHFHLGSEQFFAQRAQARALLVQAVAFDYYVLALGALFGFILKRIKISPLLVLGGLLMPLSLSLLLVLGGFISTFFKNKQEYEPLCSGVYAANALTMFMGVFL